MDSKSRQQGAGTGFVDISTHLNISSDPIFPLSSPNLDDRLSVRSIRTECYQHSRLPSESDSSTLFSTTDGDGFVRDNDKLPLRMYDEDKTHPIRFKKMRSETRRVVQKNPQTGLRIITKLPQPQSRPGQVIFNRVAAKPTGFSINRPHSILSHKGINVLPSPLPKKQSIRARRDRDVGQRSTKQSKARVTPPSPTRSSVMFGLRVPEHEARFHENNDIRQSAVTLITPDTPMILATSIDKTTSHSSRLVANKDGGHARETSPTSTYSRTNVPYTDRRHSSDSQQQILGDNDDATRPKSQGWWNLMLSPVMSRAGTLKRLKASGGDVIPPVPAIPTSAERNMAPQTPATVMSPATPRRLGIATMRTSTHSQETDWEDESDLSQDDVSSIHEAVPVSPRECLAKGLHLATHSEFPEGVRGEGLAAEYYHACAIEQLANITYFECVNHSCADRLPQLHSIFDVQDKNPGPDNLATDGKSKYDANRSLAGSSYLESDTGRSSFALKPDHDDPISHHSKPELCLQTQDTLSTTINMMDKGEVVSPNLRQASTAKFSKAKAVKSDRPSPAPSSAHVDPMMKHLNIQSTDNIPLQSSVDSPGPISPEANRAIAPAGAVSMASLQSVSAELTAPSQAPVPQQIHAFAPTQQPPTTIIYYPYGQAGPYQMVVPPPQQYPVDQAAAPPILRQINQHDFGATTVHGESSNAPESDPSTNAREHSFSPVGLAIRPMETEEDTKKVADEEATKSEKTRKLKLKNTGGNKRFVGVFSCWGRSKTKDTKHRRRNIIIATILVIIIVLCILFAVLFTRGHGGAESVESQWLNLTGFPPIPTGISTIARPNLSASQDRCVQPSTMWSCSLPREEQASVSPNGPDQPNFRFQISFENGTVPANMTIALDGRVSGSSTGESFVPNPSPPTQLDQIFLGNTTDNVTKPFDGETTPFFITFMAAISDQAAETNVTRKLLKRQTDTSDPLNSIPAPSLGVDGTASPASLLPTTPFPISQPIKLYNRGLPDEHYGFYTYFDKSIFLSGVALGNSSAADNSLTPVAVDQNGGSTKFEANVRCTWSQTRFIVKMFTNPAFGVSLLPSLITNTTKPNNSNTNKTSSATNFSRPGSFPYPTTITLDRHGGDINKKLLYCYGQKNGFTVLSSKILVAEVRSFGGVLINPSPRLLNDPSNPGFDSNLGGIDGGTGGCGCRWQNFS